MRKWIIGGWFALFALLACHGPHEPHTHDGESHSHGESDADHAEAHEHDQPGESVTLWTEDLYLYVEFPRLVLGRESEFVIHFTHASNHRPLLSGNVFVRLHYQDQKEDLAGVPNASSPGIFRPTVTPTMAGPVQVELQISSKALQSTFPLGTFSVYPDPETATNAAHEETPSQISFSLEKQWKVPFAVAPTQTKLLRPSIPAFSSIKAPGDRTTTLTAPHSGRILSGAEPGLKVGGSVKKGTVLFTLALAPSQDDVDPATLKAAVAQAKIHSEGTQKVYERAKALADKGLLDEATLDEAHEEWMEAVAEFEGAQQRLILFSNSQSLTKAEGSFALPSPIDGVITEVLIPAGAWVKEGQPLVKILNRQVLWLELAVAETYLPRIQEVHGAWFSLNDPESKVYHLKKESFLGSGGEVDSHTRTLPFRFVIQNDNDRLYPGMAFRGQLISAAPEFHLAIPHSALVRDGGVDVVFVQTAGEMFEKRMVEVGIRDGEWVGIRNGLQEGEWVVSKGAYLVKLASTDTQSLGHGHAH